MINKIKSPLNIFPAPTVSLSAFEWFRKNFDSRRLFSLPAALFYPLICPACLTHPVNSRTEWCWKCRLRVPELPAGRCFGCGGANIGPLEMCGECLAAPARPWQRAVSVYPYGGYIREIVHHFKYRNGTMLAPLLGLRMKQAWEKHGAQEKIDGIVPLPLHPLKEFRRGYNQSLLLAQEIARGLNLPILNILRRRHYSRQQARLDFEHRQTNIKNAFHCATKVEAASLNLLLIDDVFTTGATLTGAAEALRKADPASLYVLTLARG